MTDEEIYQVIEDNKEATEAFYQKIHTQVEASIIKHAEVKKRRRKNMRVLFPTVTAFILVLCLAVVLPIVLQTEDEPSIRYFDDLTLKSEELSVTLHDYYETLGEAVLYLDWYDTADECITTRYFDENNADTTVYLEEFFVHEDGYFVDMVVMQDDIVVESFEEDWETITEVHGVSVSYLVQSMKEYVKVKFEYNGYKYYVQLQESTDKDFLLSVIESMIPQQ